MLLGLKSKIANPIMKISLFVCVLR